ncbi:MAG: hypothetical protein PVF58_15460 [Candidatus Methanofastidiosia archaeon]|jgi:hypothetical protein
MSSDEYSEHSDSGGSYPRTESTMFTREELSKHIDNILHNAGIVGKGDLYPSPQETRKEKLDRLLGNIDFEDEDPMGERIIQEDARAMEPSTRLSDIVEEKVELSENLEVSSEEDFSREDFEKIQQKVSETEEGALESI